MEKIPKEISEALLRINKDELLEKFNEIIKPSITTKQCRTVVCNEVLVTNLKKQKITKNNTDAEKLRAIFIANLEIAKQLNHQKNIGKNQTTGEEKIAERVQKAKERKQKLNDTFVERRTALINQAKKYEKLYEKMPKLLEEKAFEIGEKIRKLEIQLEKAEASVEKTELALDKKKLTADISLGTSLTNYADLRIIKSYCDDIQLPIEKIFTANQLKWINPLIENTPVGYWRNYPS